MLTELHIENIAVIERADIEPVSGLNVLTGETGAGKSIVIDSLSAVLGGRASRDLVRFGADRASVTAVFTTEGAEAWFTENDIEPEDSFVIRRRISSDGKSAATVNGVSVSALQLRSLGARLLDIHGQNDGRQLMDEARHRDYLDGFAGLSAELDAYRALYADYRAALAELHSLNMGEEEKRRLEESLRYRIEELSAADLKAGEEKALESRRELLRNAEKLTESVDDAYEALYGRDGSAAELLGSAATAAGRAALLAPELSQAATQIREALAISEDAAERLRDFKNSLDFAPEEYDALETRLSQLRRLEKKYSADESGLIALLADCERRLDELAYADERREKLQGLLAEKEKTAYNFAHGLSKKRREAGLALQKRIESGLRELNMPSVLFETELLPLSGAPGFDENGCDTVRFLMSANAGEKPGRIARIASGGELARIMLVMKDVLSERDTVQSMVFDEIDEGVSGIAAQRVGEKLGRLSRRKQVICITHLPQIAAMADCHFRIEKTERGGRTYTAVTPLDRDGRTHELARLHGGANITATTLKSADEQLTSATEYKNTLKGEQ
ncbi:MAG: DNA repair protein RecN [Oscillospiraceae bacterium]